MGEVGNVAEFLGQAVALLGGFFGFLGMTGIVLFVMSLVLLALTGSFSPLPKLANYLTVVVLVACILLFGLQGVGEMQDKINALGPYLAVMLAPVAALYLIRGAFGAIFKGRSETEQLKEAVTELTEQVAALRRDRQGERLETREMLTIEAEAKPALKAEKLPRRLVRRLPRS